MQGSKRYGYTGYYHYYDWKKVKKRLLKEFCFDSKRFKITFDGAQDKFKVFFDNELIWQTQFLDEFYGIRKGYCPYGHLSSFLRMTENYFSIAKKDLIDYNIDEKKDPLGFIILLKCMDKRIGVRRLEKMYCDLVFDGLLDGKNVKPGITVLQSRIGTKEIKNV